MDRLVKTAAVAALAVVGAAAQPLGPGDGLGRLFSTPEERRAAEEARRAPLPEPPAAEDAGSAAGQAEWWRFDGLLRRPDGRIELWLNGRRWDPAQVGLEVQPDGDAVWLRFPGGRRVRLAPGQRLRLQDGAVLDAFEAATASAPAAVAERPPEPAPEPAAPAEPFDESELVEQVGRIRLLEERLERIESQLPGKRDATR